MEWKMRKKILIDMDDCILDFESTWKQALIEMIGDVEFPERKSFYIYHDMDDSYHSIARTVADQPGLFERFTPYENALNALEQLDSLFDIELVTAPHTSNLNCYTEKAKWIKAHLGKSWLDKLTITKDKKQVLGDFLIDDHPNVVGRQHVVPTWEQIVFHQSYNADVECVHRLHSWKQEDLALLINFLLK